MWCYYFENSQGGILEIIDYIILNNFKKIGIDPSLISIQQFEIINNKLKDNGIKIFKDKKNLVDLIWLNKPLFPISNLIDYPLKYAGKTRNEKIKNLNNFMKKNNAVIYILFKSYILDKEILKHLF